MKTTIQKLTMISLILTTSIQTTSAKTVNGVWDQVTSDSYSLPQNEISLSSLYAWGKDLIKIAANRTLADTSDILPQFNKLAHPNGVCLKGSWNITEENIYSGYFKKGSQGIIISRASTAMSNTKRGGYRAFGLAGKIFATTNASEELSNTSANFFLVDDLGGTMAPHYTDVAMTNEPLVSTTSAVLKALAYALKLKKTFGKADSNPGMRQLYEISELGETNLSNIKTPKWMEVKAVRGQTVNEADFRNELNINNRRSNLIFEISVASTVDNNGDKNWKTIGIINFDSSIVSNSCDHRLHFHHPKWRTNLNH